MRGNSTFPEAISDLVDDIEAHLTGSAGDDAEGGFVTPRVEVFPLRFHDIHYLFARDLADFGFVRFFRASGDVCRFFQQHRCGGRLGDKGEAFIFKNSDDYRKNVAGLFLGRGIKLLAERHDVNTSRSQGRADRGRWIGLSGRNLELYLCNYFLGHLNY